MTREMAGSLLGGPVNGEAELVLTSLVLNAAICSITSSWPPLIVSAPRGSRDSPKSLSSSSKNSFAADTPRNSSSVILASSSWPSSSHASAEAPKVSSLNSSKASKSSLVFSPTSRPPPGSIFNK